jgi:predicted dehydrogenase
VLHNDLITLALTKKYHVYSERPINPSARDASVVTLLLLAKENKKLLYSGVQRRIEDTFRYLFYCINNHIEFEDIATITIRLLSGRKITGWRNNFNLAGGGIVTDEGYHLLDMAIWILMAENADLKIYHDNVEGSVVFRDKKGNMLNGNESEVEHEAFGFLTIDNVFLNFELSYNAPLDSVFELIEVKDRNGNRIRLLRDQPQRSTNPAKIIHQRGDGSFVNVNLDYQDPVANERYLNQFKLRTESISFNSEARNFGPLQQFLENIPNCNEVLNTRPVIILGKNDCDAHFISNTDNLIKAIYRIALKH